MAFKEGRFKRQEMLYPCSFQAFLALTLWLLRGAQGLECSLGFGNSARVIPDKWINDGYCDCPLDAADETETNACSGSAIGGWAGVSGTADRRYVCLARMKYRCAELNNTMLQSLKLVNFIPPPFYR